MGTILLKNPAFPPRYSICFYFKQGAQVEMEQVLYDRIAINYVALFLTVPFAMKDLFFSHLADAMAQAVL